MANLLNIATLIGVLFAAVSLRAAQRARFRSFEDLYVVRYWSLLDQMPRSTAELDTTDQRVLWAYLRLTEDQLDMRKVGWVTDETWKLWADGMARELQRSPVAEVWAEARVSVDGFEQIRRFESTGFDQRHDPCAMRLSRRWVRGIASLPV